MVMALSDILWEPDGSWRDQAACAGSDTDLFFPIGEDDDVAASAKAVCAICPVKDECLQYALATNQTDGVWGGLTGAERRRLRRRLRDRERRAS
jgi:WhiB family transcriptional regulator, redox-sensing transcriptional regulator